MSSGPSLTGRSALCEISSFLSCPSSAWPTLVSLVCRHLKIRSSTLLRTCMHDSQGR
jgi:hypothetical protein